MSRARVGDRVRVSTPGWEALDRHEGTVEAMQPNPFPYAVRCDDGALRRYSASEVDRIALQTNGARLVHGEARLRGIDWINGARWHLTSRKPTRIRTCRGSRR